MSDRRLVYSTDPARPRALPDAAGSRTSAAPRGPDDGVVRILRDRGGRDGKVVTVVRGLPGDRAAWTGLAAELRRLCGAGGAVKADAVELQGDHRERVAGWLRARGHRVKLAGG